MLRLTVQGLDNVVSNGSIMVSTVCFFLSKITKTYVLSIGQYGFENFAIGQFQNFLAPLYPRPLPQPIPMALPMAIPTAYTHGLYPCPYISLCLYQAMASTHASTSASASTKPWPLPISSTLGPIPCPMPPPPPTAYTHGLYPWHIPRLIPMALPMASTHRLCPWPLTMASTMQA